MTTMLEALREFDSGDTYDTEIDDGVCWDYYGEPKDILHDPQEDLCSLSGALVQERVEMTEVRDCSYGKEFLADISSFVKAHVDVLYDISQCHTESMISKDIEEEWNWYVGVRIVNAMQCGYATDDEYMLMVRELAPDMAEEWCRLYGKSWLAQNEKAGWLGDMIPEAVEYVRRYSCP